MKLEDATAVRMGSAVVQRMMKGDTQVWPHVWNPLEEIPWEYAHWVEGPAFKALGLADGATVTSWPDETGGPAMTTIFGTPIYRSSVAGLNGRPGIEAFGDEAMNTASITNTPQPWSVVLIARSDDPGGGDRVGGSTGNTVARAGVRIWQSFGAGMVIGLGAAGDIDTSLPHVWDAHANGADSHLRVDNVLRQSGNAGTDQFIRKMVMGSNSSNPSVGLDGHIVFAAWIYRALTTDERSALHAWAQEYYGAA